MFSFLMSKLYCNYYNYIIIMGVVTQSLLHWPSPGLHTVPSLSSYLYLLHCLKYCTFNVIYYTLLGLILVELLRR